MNTVDVYLRAPVAVERVFLGVFDLEHLEPLTAAIIEHGLSGTADGLDVSGQFFIAPPSAHDFRAIAGFEIVCEVPDHD
jgi:hypothetical protein